MSKSTNSGSIAELLHPKRVASVREWEIDTNAGPILSYRGTVQQTKQHVERCIGMLRQRGYSCSWRRSNDWYVIDVANSRGRVVHSAAFIDKSKRPNPVHEWGKLGTVEHTSDCECHTRSVARTHVNGHEIVERVGTIVVVQASSCFVVFRGGPLGERKTIDGARRLAERMSERYDGKR